MNRHALFSCLIAAMLLWHGVVVHAAPAGSPWGANYFPNVTLTTHEGKQVKFYDDLLKGKVVAINFIFTTCSQTCPAETAKLRQVQKILGNRVGRDVFFYSISVDPHDTPAIMTAYAKKFEVEPGWQFLTGKYEDVILLRKKLGLYRGPEEELNKAEHATTLIVGNETTGQWMKRSPFDNSQVLAEVLGGWLHNWKVAEGKANPRPSYANATRLPSFSKGEQLFRTRCVACHTIGGGDGVGPDLKGVVEARVKPWLMRWLIEPDRMIAEKEPVAMALYQKYKEVKMPNFGLTESDALGLIEYMKSAETGKPLHSASQ